MDLGNFSVSLTVKDIKASKEFYEKLGFVVFGGDISRNYLILQNGKCTVGLFQGMFEKNILTFNPGWNQKAETLSTYTDIRELKKELKSKGISIITDGVKETSGPGSLVIEDPDGNPILLDQHV